jgi:hypothetical protein
LHRMMNLLLVLFRKFSWLICFKRHVVWIISRK